MCEVYVVCTQVCFHYFLQVRYFLVEPNCLWNGWMIMLSLKRDGTRYRQSTGHRVTCPMLGLMWGKFFFSLMSRNEVVTLQTL